MEQLNFPAQGIPLQLLDRILKRPNRQVCNELPVDSLSIFRLALLTGMNHRHLQGRVMLLLPDRRQELNPFVFDLKDGNVRIGIGVTKFEAMRSADLDPLHFVGDRMMSVARQAIDAGPDQEMGANFLRRAEELIDIALTISNVDAARWIAQGCGGLPEVFQPADALLLLDRNPVRLTLFLSAAVPLNFLRVQNLIAANPSGRPSLVTARLECIRMPQTV